MILSFFGVSQVLFHIMCDAVAIRRLLCSPIFSECETDHEHTFWATGSSGRLKKWDTRWVGQRECGVVHWVLCSKHVKQHHHCSEDHSGWTSQVS